MKNETIVNSNPTININNGVIIQTLPPMNVTANELKSVEKRNGFLKKLGGKGISKNWRRRYFVLTNTGILYYFKQKTSSEAVGAVDLSLYTKCYKDKGKKNYFFITNENDPTQRVFHLIADSPQEMEEWITVITSFFDGDVSDLKLHLLGVKQQKSESKLTVALSPKREEDLDKFQLVFKGERVSLLLSDLNLNGSGSYTSSSGVVVSGSPSSLSPFDQSPKPSKRPSPTAEAAQDISSDTLSTPSTQDTPIPSNTQEKQTEESTIVDQDDQANGATESNQ